MSRGRGRGGKPSIFTPQLLGHLDHADIIKESLKGDVLYPPAPMPDTSEPSTREAAIARRYNSKMNANMKFLPYWQDAPAKTSSNIEKYSDRYTAGSSMAEGKTLESYQLEKDWDRNLFPVNTFEAIFDRKKKVKTMKVGRSGQKSAKDLIDQEEGAELPDSDEEEMEEEEMELEDDEEGEDEDENDYGDNHFDDGADSGGEGGDALGGGGDEDGGTFD